MPDTKDITITRKQLRDLLDLLWDAKSHLNMHLKLSSNNLRSSQEGGPWKPTLPFPPQIELGDKVVASLLATIDELGALQAPEDEVEHSH